MLPARSPAPISARNKQHPGLSWAPAPRIRQTNSHVIVVLRPLCPRPRRPTPPTHTLSSSSSSPSPPPSAPSAGIRRVGVEWGSIRTRGCANPPYRV
ncbi:hypothetical protein EJB05_57900, partial [Eragrostis curvula]